jgi:hypothetical protein
MFTECLENITLRCILTLFDITFRESLISSSGDQTYAMSGNGNILIYYICVALCVSRFD